MYLTFYVLMYLINVFNVFMYLCINAFNYCEQIKQFIHAF